MAYWRAASVGLVCLLSACGGSEFEESSPAGGGSAGSGGTSATGGSGGASGGAPSGGTAGVSAGGSAGVATGGSAGAGGAPQGISIVNVTDTAMTLTDNVPTLTLSASPSAGNAIIVGITCQSTTDYCELPDGSVSDNQGNTYSRVIQGEAVTSSAQGARPYIFIAESIVAPNGPVVISVDPNGEVPPDIQLVAWGAIEVAGLAAPPSFDASGASLVGGDYATETTAVTDLPTTQPNELAIGVLTMRSDDTNMLITPAAGWTSHHHNQNGASGPPGHSMVSQVLTSADIISHTWTHDVPTRGVAAVIATFRGAVVRP